MKDIKFDPYDFFGYLASGYLIVGALQLIVGVPDFYGRDLKAFELIILTIGAYILGHISASPAKFLLEDIVVHKLLKAPSETLMSDAKNGLFRYISPGYYKPLPEEIRTRIRNRAKNEGCPTCTGESLFLHVRFRDYMRTDAILMERLGQFVNKYGFNRNLSSTCIIFGCIVLVFEGIDFCSDSTKYALISLVVGFLLFLRYLKFFRQYSYELFNTYAGKD